MTDTLDLDTLLQSSPATSDDDDVTTPLRTVDDILNDSEITDNDTVLHPTSKPSNLSLYKRNLIQRYKSDDFYSRKPPPAPTSMFGAGVRSAAKPGAALAAAAAASRSIKPRRAVKLSSAGGDKLFDVSDSVSSVSGGVGVNSVINCRDHSFVDSVGEIEECAGVMKSEECSVSNSGVETGVNGVESGIEERSVNSEVEKGDQVDQSGREECVREESVNPGVETSNEAAESVNSAVEDVEARNKVEESVISAVEGVETRDEVEESVISAVGGVEARNKVVDESGEKTNEIELVDDVAKTDNDSGESTGSDDVRELVEELVEDRIAEIENEREGKKAEEDEEEKSRSKKRPLELAEERENKQASTLQDWEEGAAAQPMRLEGVRRGSTVLGYFDVNADNAISRTIKSQVFRRDYGTPQVLAMHMSYIALGMSKGVVVVVPSKYSAHHADSLDTKMLMLGAQGDRSQVPVTSICFNQQGDLLLAGYGDGHVTFWSLPRGTVSKVVTGEHKAAVAHTLFLGQDSQASRQYKAVTGDCKGLVQLHEISVMALFGFQIKTQCLLDGKTTGTVLCASPLLPDNFNGAASGIISGNTPGSTSSIAGVMGGVVGGAAGWKLFTEGSSLSEEGVVIFVTHQNALVVRLSPSLEVYAQLPKPEGVREGSMPYTAWKCTTQSQGSSTENMNPEPLEKISLLAIAWDRKVQVAKLVKSELKVCGKWTLESAAIGLAWLDDQMLVILTLAGQLCLFTRDGTLIHQTSYAINVTGGDDLIAYHTYFTNVFGNPEKAYHNSLAVRGASVYILAPTHLVVSRLLLWRERIQVLRNAGDWMGAFNMAMTLYDGQAHGVIDLPRDLQAVQESIMPYLVELLFAYVDEVFSYISVACSNQIGRVEQVDGAVGTSNSAYIEIKEQFTRVGGVAVEFCVHIKRTDILFDEVFSKFVAVHHRDTFLELLEPYILKDMLGSLPPEIMQALVEHYNDKGWLQRVEQCVLHMDISSLDFNQVVRLCRDNGLYGALIYLFNKGLDDFKTPLEELLSVLRNQQRDATAVGYRMLVYLKYCFSGLAFPPGIFGHGTLPYERVPSLKVELVQFLLEDSGGPKTQMGASLSSTGTYLNLHYLLELDTEATLDVLRIAFVEDENFKPENSSHQTQDTTIDTLKEKYSVTGDQNMMVQKTVDALVLILDIDISQTVRSTGNDDTQLGIWPSKKDIGHLIEFIASYVASGRANVSKSVLSQILEYLTSEDYLLPNDSEQLYESKKSRERKVQALLDAVPQTEWNGSYVLHLCEKAQFFKVCAFIYTIRRQYVAALDSYMKDVDEPVHAFSFIDGLLLQLSEPESVSFRAAVMSRISELITLSRECTFFLLSSHFSKEITRTLSELKSTPKSLFLYLKTLVEVHLSGTLNFSCGSGSYVLDGPWSRRIKDGNNYIEAYHERISGFPKFIRDNPVEVTDDMVELYLEMLCQHEPDSVLKFLDTFENYRVDRCLQLCQKYGIVDAAAFLLERVGDVGSALLLVLSDINNKFIMLDTAVRNMVSDMGKGKRADEDYLAASLGLKEVQDIKKVLHACVSLCQRNTPRLDSEESESLWFHFLDSFCKPLIISQENSDDVLAQFSSSKDDREGNTITWRVSRTQKYAPLLKKLFAQFVKEIVEGMIGFVRLPSIMSKLLSDNGGQEFGDFKLTILGMLGTYNFERRILDTAKCLIEDDTFYTMSVLKKGAVKGYSPRSLSCCICNFPFNKSSSSSGIRVFCCGHAAHLHCELQESGTSIQGTSSGCPICVPKKKTKAKGKVVEQALVNTSPPYRSLRTQGATILHPHEIDALENSGGAHQISRFEMLNGLQRNQRLIQTDTMPQLRLAPPAVYHEKVNKRNHFSARGSSEGLMDIEKPSKSRQLRDLKVKGSSIRFPLKSKIFGKEKTRVQ